VILGADFQVWLRFLEKQIERVDRFIAGRSTEYWDEDQLAVIELATLDDLRLLQFQKKHQSTGCLVFCGHQGCFQGLALNFPLEVAPGLKEKIVGKDWLCGFHLEIWKSQLALLRYQSSELAWQSAYLALLEETRNFCAKGSPVIEATHRPPARFLREPDLCMDRDALGEAKASFEVLRSFQAIVQSKFQLPVYWKPNEAHHYHRPTNSEFESVFSDQSSSEGELTEDPEIRLDSRGFITPISQFASLLVTDVAFYSDLTRADISFELGFNSGASLLAYKGNASLSSRPNGLWEVDNFYYHNLLFERVKEKVLTGLGPPGYLFGRVTEFADDEPAKES